MNAKGGESGRTTKVVGIAVTGRTVGREGELRFAHTKISGDAACARVERERGEGSRTRPKVKPASRRSLAVGARPRYWKGRCVVIYVNVRKRLSQILSFHRTHLIFTSLAREYRQRQTKPLDDRV